MRLNFRSFEKKDRLRIHILHVNLVTSCVYDRQYFRFTKSAGKNNIKVLNNITKINILKCELNFGKVDSY